MYIKPYDVFSFSNQKRRNASYASMDRMTLEKEKISYGFIYIYMYIPGFVMEF